MPESMGIANRLKKAFVVFFATLLASHQVEPARLREGEDEQEQPHTHQEAIEPEDVLWEEDEQGGAPTTAALRPALLVSNNVAILRQCVPNNVALLDKDKRTGPITPDFQVTIRESHKAVFKTRAGAVMDQKHEGTITTGFYGDPDVGRWEFGSRIRLTFHIVTGVSLFVPVSVKLSAILPDLPTAVSSGTSTGSLHLLETSNQGRATEPSRFSSSNAYGLAPVSNGSSGWEGSSMGYATYEVISCDPNVLQTAVIDVYVAYLPDLENFRPFGTSTVTASLCPSYSPLEMFPRRDISTRSRDAFFIVQCSTTLLFSFVTCQAGFDTAIIIANTSLDPFGTPGESGTVTLNYYGNITGGHSAPPAQRSTVVPPGAVLLFTLSNGGNFGIAATPGFQGYIIAIANFRYCHGLAFVNPLGAQHGPGYSYPAVEIQRASKSYASILPS